jgi:hypothetical protein
MKFRCSAVRWPVTPGVAGSSPVHSIICFPVNAIEGPLVRIVPDPYLVALRSRPKSDVFQRIGRFIGLPEPEWRALSGHSAQVASTQDLFAATVELPAIMQQGRWKDARLMWHDGSAGDPIRPLVKSRSLQCRGSQYSIRIQE